MLYASVPSLRLMARSITDCLLVAYYNCYSVYHYCCSANLLFIFQRKGFRKNTCNFLCKIFYSTKNPVQTVNNNASISQCYYSVALHIEKSYSFLLLCVPCQEIIQDCTQSLLRNHLNNLLKVKNITCFNLIIAVIVHINVKSSHIASERTFHQISLYNPQCTYMLQNLISSSRQF